jgi:hypothetical protein
VLEHAKREGVKVTKTSIMLGVGETDEQVVDALKGERHAFQTFRFSSYGPQNYAILMWTLSHSGNTCDPQNDT